jgi:hypothetical protein
MSRSLLLHPQPLSLEQFLILHLPCAILQACDLHNIGKNAATAGALLQTCTCSPAANTKSTNTVLSCACIVAFLIYSVSTDSRNEQGAANASELSARRVRHFGGE